MASRRSHLSAFIMAASMTIFGTIGIFRRTIPVGSATLAALRGFIGVGTVGIIMLFLRQKPDGKAIRQNLLLLLLSGAFIGVNWILLFEAYEHTTVAVATLCYYMSPVFAVLAAAVFLRERLTLRKLLCVLVATVGMVGVSGVIGGGAGKNDFTGVLLGLAAAVFYATVIILNKKIRDIPAYDKTVIQLLAAAVVVTPYALLAEGVDPAAFTPAVIGLILTVGVINTGVAYALYFGSIGQLPTQTVAFLGYIDPIVAILLSVTVLSEPIGIYEIIGMICILGAAVVGELPERKKKTGR